MSKVLAPNSLTLGGVLIPMPVHVLPPGVVPKLPSYVSWDGVEWAAYSTERGVREVARAKSFETVVEAVGGSGRTAFVTSEGQLEAYQDAPEVFMGVDIGLVSGDKTVATVVAVAPDGDVTVVSAVGPEAVPSVVAVGPEDEVVAGTTYHTSDGRNGSVSEATKKKIVLAIAGAEVEFTLRGNKRFVEKGQPTEDGAYLAR